jgi:hypothetical protein
LAQRTEADLLEDFTKATASVFEKAKAKPSPGTAQLLRDLISDAAARLVSDKRNSDRDASATVGILRRFASEMVKKGVRQQDGSLLLGDDAFQTAQRSLCPLYPLC